jgi:phosphoribosylpyrophosphate synthetase
MISQEMRQQVRDRLHREVGGFFTNTSRGPGTCAVCRGPAEANLCGQCAEQRAAYGDQLADQVVILAYAKGRMTTLHQSAHHMLRYKHRINPSEECQRDLKLMVLSATSLHGECMARAHGWWHTITFVSSATRPGTDHPVVLLAQQVVPFEDRARILLDHGPSIDASGRFPLPDRFIISENYKPDVAGHHVLVVDDTWVSGDKAQSAALTLKAAGAATVTILCVARWLDWTYNDAHQQLIKASTAPYDALICPVTGGECPPLLPVS